MHSIVSPQGQRARLSPAASPCCHLAPIPQSTGCHLAPGGWIECVLWNSFLIKQGVLEQSNVDVWVLGFIGFSCFKYEAHYAQRRRQVWGMEKKALLMGSRKGQHELVWFGLIGLGTGRVLVTWSVYRTAEIRGVERAVVPHRTPTSLPARIPPKETLGPQSLICHGKSTTNTLPLIQAMFAESCLVPVWDPGDWTRLPEQWVIVSWGDSDTPSKKAMKQAGVKRDI